MDPKDLKVAAAMIGGAVFGALLGWLLFPERYNIVSCGVIGSGFGQFVTIWWLRRSSNKKGAKNKQNR
ncbi:MAG: hypothetical protein OXP09_15260 [Gammaproteobacteria bacterium]|nr:hypothetical protein [Gammaproteobacteria bacterium]MDE0366918.1 hypothetical protein [Gammaproteobacteria bacterium]